MQIKDAVAMVGLFQGLGDEQLENLAHICLLKDVPHGQMLFHAGEEAAGFYAVISGQVRIFKTAFSGKEHILHVFGPGEAFAEVAVFSGGSFPADAQATKASTLAFFPRDRFARVIGEDPELAMKMLGLMSQRLRQFVSKIEALSLKEVPSRLATHLLLLRSAQGKESFKLDLPKGQLASFLGTIPETLSRVLKKMVEEGAIELQGSNVRLVDMSMLEELAEGVKKM